MKRKNPAAVALGRKGGKAGTGAAKARSSAVAKAAALERWKNHTARPGRSNIAVRHAEDGAKHAL